MIDKIEAIIENKINISLYKNGQNGIIIDELELINGFELVNECKIKMCNNINRPINTS